MIVMVIENIIVYCNHKRIGISTIDVTQVINDGPSLTFPFLHTASVKNGTVGRSGSEATSVRVCVILWAGLIAQVGILWRLLNVGKPSLCTENPPKHIDGFLFVLLPLY